MFRQGGAFLRVPALSVGAHCEYHPFSKRHQSELKASLEKLDLVVFYMKESKQMGKRAYVSDTRRWYSLKSQGDFETWLSS